MRIEEIIVAEAIARTIKPLHQKINKLTDELTAIKEHFGLEVYYRPGKLLVEQWKTEQPEGPSINECCCNETKDKDVIIMDDETA